jgi:hypothetical protein
MRIYSAWASIVRLLRIPLERHRGVTISDEYIRLNRELHRRLDAYGTSAPRWTDAVRRVQQLTGAANVLDYGCGKALLSKQLGGQIDVINYDPAVERYAARPEPADLVVCIDVLEHIEPHLLDAVVSDIRDLCRKAVFAVVSTRPAAKTLADGRNAHLIQQKPDWWDRRLSRHFEWVHRLGHSESTDEAVFVMSKHREGGSFSDNSFDAVGELTREVQRIFDAPR